MVELNIKNWLKAEDITQEDFLTFINEGFQAEIPQSGDKPAVKTFEIDVKLPNGEVKTWTMNKTSQRAVASKYGLDTKNWVGKSVCVFWSEQSIDGTMRKVIYARAPIE